MSKVKIQGNASGTGVLTITAPNTSTDRTITLPDSTATIATTTDVAARLPSITDNGNANAITIDSSENVDFAGANLTMTDGSLKSGVSGTFNINGATGTAGAPAYCTYGFNGDVNTGMYSGTADTIKFATGGAERVRIQSGGGISFNGDTAAANALDDYEEGTWSPDLVGHTGSAGSHAHNLVGHYIKVGGLVWVRAYGYLTNKGSYSGNARLNGFPFAPDNATAGTLAMFPSTEVDANMRTINVTGSTTKADFMKGSRLDIAVPWSEIVTSYYLSASVVYAHT